MKKRKSRAPNSMTHCAHRILPVSRGSPPHARRNAYRAVNFTMVEAYWNVGRMIVEEEQQGKERAEYGEAFIQMLSDYG